MIESYSNGCIGSAGQPNGPSQSLIAWVAKVGVKFGDRTVQRGVVHNLAASILHRVVLKDIREPNTPGGEPPACP